MAHKKRKCDHGTDAYDLIPPVFGSGLKVNEPNTCKEILINHFEGEILRSREFLYDPILLAHASILFYDATDKVDALPRFLAAIVAPQPGPGAWFGGTGAHRPTFTHTRVHTTQPYGWS